MVGIGLLIYSNRDTYEGNFEAGMKNGHGVYQWSSGYRYDGHWKNDKKHGHGALTEPDGTVTVDEFVDDQFADDVEEKWVRTLAPAVPISSTFYIAKIIIKYNTVFWISLQLFDS